MHRNTKVILFTVILMTGFACKAPETQIDGVIKVDEAVAMLSKDASVVMLDVRTPAEYEVAHIENSINIDINAEDFAERVALLDREKTYIVHCAANVKNGRTEKSLDIMKGLEFNSLLDLEGGIIAWQESGYPVVQ